MECAWRRQIFECSLLGPYLSLFLPLLLKDIHGRDFDHVNHGELAKTYPRVDALSLWRMRV